MGELELPLVIFTVLSQLAVGGLIVLWSLEFSKTTVSVSTGKKVAGSLVIIVAAALLASLFHLGKPLEAYRAITHVGSSWLSNEIVSFSAFFIVAVAYFFLWEEGKESARTLVGAILTGIGVFSIFATGMAYHMPSVPAWDNVAPFVFFALTAILLGATYVGSAVIILDKKPVNLYKLIIAAVLVSLISTVLYISMLSGGTESAAMTAENMMNSGAFWFRAILTWLVPLVLLGMVFLSKSKKVDNTTILFSLFITLFIGELVGRVLFYSTAVGLEVGQFFR